MNKLQLLITIICCVIILQSCENRICCEIPPDCCYSPATISIKIKNNKGEDLLDQSKPTAFKIEDFRVFHYYNGQNLYVNESNNINRLILRTNETFTDYDVILSQKIEEDISRTILKWNNKSIDTLDAVFSSDRKLLKLILNQKDTFPVDELKYRSAFYSLTLIK